MKMNLGISIANLLRRYPAVGVPGIGVFRRTYRPAVYDSEQSRIHPPSHDIELVEDAADVFALTAYLVSQQQLDEQTATTILERVVTDVKADITRNGEAMLDGLGYLVAEGKSLAFRPFPTHGIAARPVAVLRPEIKEESTPEADVTVVDPTALSQEEDNPVPAAEGAAAEVAEVETAPETEVAREAVADEMAATDEVAQLPEAEAVENGTTSRMPWIIGGAAAVLLVVAVSVWQLRPAWFGMEGNAQVVATDVSTASSLDEGEDSDGIVGMDSTASDTVGTGSVPAGLGTGAPADTVPATAVTPTKKPSVTYEIIVGSFATMNQADKFVAQMKARGYDNLQALDSRMPGNRKKISWGSYATEEEAYRELTRVQKTFEPGAWIAKVVNE